MSIDGLADEPGQEVEAREREESKRLVYVALTRARDRLYLATTLSRQGAFAPASTSLGAVLPASLGAALAAAAHASDGAIDWRAASGRVHPLRVVSAESALVSTGTAPAAALDDFGPLVLAAREPTRLSEVTAGGPLDASTPSQAPATRAAGPRRRHARASRPRRRCAGGHRGGPRAARWTSTAKATTPPPGPRRVAGSRPSPPGPTSPRSSAGRMCSMRCRCRCYGPDGAIVRAVVDMIVHRPDGVVVVAEFKTGAPRPADDRQLAAYAAGIEALVPGSIVQSRVIRVDL